MADIDEFSEDRLLEVASYLARVREMHKLTQKQAANAAGMTSAGYLSLIEAGKRMISIKTLEKLAIAYPMVPFEEMVAVIGFTKKGKLLPKKSKNDFSMPADEREVAEAEIIKPAAAQQVKPLAAEQLSMVDAALQFISHDKDFQMPFPPRTTREKALVVASYQQSTKRQLLMDSELQILSGQD